MMQVSQGTLLEFFTSPLNQVIWLPIIGLIAIALVTWEEENPFNRKLVGGLATLFTLLPAVPIAGMLYEPFARFLSRATGGLINYFPDNIFLAGQSIDQNPMFQINWLKRTDFHITYTVQIDGLSMALLVLSVIVFTMAAFASLQLIEKERKRYFMLFLLLQTSIYGVFLAFDYVLFFVFWELMLVPVYLLITGWGGAERDSAGMKFIVYTIFGSVFMLFPIVLSILEVNAGAATSTYHAWLPRFFFANPDQNPALALAPLTRTLMFAGFMISFAVKIPVFPFHTWMPDAHTEAPTPISMILAGLMLKAGAYGILRIAWPVFPEVAVELSPLLALLGVVMIIYGALLAFAQTDIKRIVAYSSLSHMGFIVAGIAAQNDVGIRAAIFMMFAHGLVSAALFWLVGLLEKRTGTRSLPELGGLMQKSPKYSFLLGVAALAAMGLPGLVVFWGEFPVIISLFGIDQAWTDMPELWGTAPDTLYAVLGVFAAFGIVFAAAYVLRLLQGTLFGPVAARFEELEDLPVGEFAAVLPLVALIVFFGVYPEPVLNLFSAFPADTLGIMERVLQQVQEYSLS